MPGELIERIESVLNRLREREREAFTLRLLGRTYPEIAARQGVTPAGAQHRCVMASRKIRWHLERSGDGRPDLQAEIDALIRFKPRWR